MYADLKDKGLEILAFPCNQFGGQEPWDVEKVESWTKSTFGRTFPVMAKIDVNGDDALPLYSWLKQDGKITWNFFKFLLDRNGKLYKAYGGAAPDSMREDVESLLKSRD